MVICLEQGADFHMVQRISLLLTVSCFSKIQICFTFLVPAHPGSPGQRAVKRVCVCVCVNYLNIYRTDLRQIFTVGRTKVVDERSKLVFTARCYASAVLAMGCVCLSVSVCVCLSQVEVLVKRLNRGSHKQHHTIAHGL